MGWNGGDGRGGGLGCVDWIYGALDTRVSQSIDNFQFGFLTSTSILHRQSFSSEGPLDRLHNSHPPTSPLPSSQLTIANTILIPMPTTTLLIAILLPPFAFLLSTLLRILRNPLRRLPAAHPLAPYTSLWIAHARWRGRENATLRDAHARAGPIVCLGPSEVSVNCVRGGVRDVYAGGMEKGVQGQGAEGYNWYGFFANFGG